MKINTLIVAVALVALNACNKQDYKIERIKKTGILVYLSEHAIFPYNTAMQSSDPDKIEGSVIGMNATGNWVFDFDFYSDIYNSNGEVSFGSKKGEEIQGELIDMKLTNVWLNSFTFSDLEIWKTGQGFSDVFESATLTFKRGDKVILLGTTDELAPEYLPIEGIIFEVNAAENLSEFLENGQLNLQLDFKEGFVENRFFEYKFVLGFETEFIYQLEK